ncbi:LysR substrate-binding domain-containing protein [Salinimicrobium sp. HB62]|uniref:LysR substrate-binding domain-containing protein n=1 Tax=Salinimicrobium sp. HB62 TaxID=3077781 RepID=UPI002D79EA01|nr:LysR substrate-binding domain-containing protein [Salinimicrobium sp. HB62]
MDVTFHQLQVFLKVCETLSITKAAEELHLSQPAVSIQIRNLQEQFEIPLLEVIGRRLFITDFGKEIAEVSRRILGEAESMKSRAAAYKGHLIGKLNITVVSTGKYVMPHFLTDFLKRHPDIELLLDVTNRARVLESLEKNEVDFALLSLSPENLKVEHIDLMDNELYLIGAKDSDFEEPQDTSFLGRVPLIFREQGSGTLKTMEGFCKKNNLKVNKRLELTSNEAVKQAVIAGLGYSVMPVIGIRQELRSGDLKVIPIEGLPIKSTWKLVWLKSKKLSPVAEAYRSFIQQEKSRIISTHFANIL